MLVAAGVCLLAACSPNSVTVTPPRPVGPVQQQCAHLGNRLPPKLAQLHSRPTEPQSPLTHAWGSPPITLKCGVPRPRRYVPASSSTLDVDGVQWFQAVGSGTVTWTAIRPGPAPERRIYVELAVPTSYQASDGYLVALAEPLKLALP
ncbi:MAG TPA: DUF3515 domain-containing protein [Mycobacteriales bacterium]|nr:DUF3515 domain-containing protein [Mycobacteriales bacterium]